MTITVNELQANAAKYIGKQVTVEADVQDVLSPRLLTIDQREALELDGDLLVFIRAPFAGLVSERARVTVTGTVEPLVRAEIDRELQWIDPNTAKLEVEFDKRPILVANSIKSDMGVELAIRVTSSGPPTASKEDRERTPTGTSGSKEQAITDISQLAGATDTKLVSREVNLTNARVVRAGDKQSFWVRDAQGGDNLLIVPADPAAVKINEGQTVSVSGVVLQMPDAWKNKFSTTQGTDEEVYVFASSVQSAR